VPASVVFVPGIGTIPNSFLRCPLASSSCLVVISGLRIPRVFIAGLEFEERGTAKLGQIFTKGGRQLRSVQPVLNLVDSFFEVREAFLLLLFHFEDPDAAFHRDGICDVAARLIPHCAFDKNPISCLLALAAFAQMRSTVPEPTNVDFNVGAIGPKCLRRKRLAFRKYWPSLR
jgi:hypothetical protein